MARATKENGTKTPKGDVACPHCGALNQLEKCPTFNGHDSNGIFCSTCRGPLDESSVQTVSFGLGTKPNNEAARSAMLEKVRDAGL